MTREEAMVDIRENIKPVVGGKSLDMAIKALPSVSPQQRTGRWERMSDLPNDVDDRFKCSRCGNIVHYNNVMDLRTFSRWCGRCGSDNG